MIDPRVVIQIPYKCPDKPVIEWNCLAKQATHVALYIEGSLAWVKLQE